MKYKIVYDSNKKSNVLFTDTDQLPYENNTQISAADFIDKVLADGKLLSVNGGSNPAPQQQQQINNNGVIKNDAINEMMQAQLNALK